MVLLYEKEPFTTLLNTPLEHRAKTWGVIKGVNAEKYTKI